MRPARENILVAIEQAGYGASEPCRKWGHKGFEVRRGGNGERRAGRPAALRRAAAFAFYTALALATLLHPAAADPQPDARLQEEHDPQQIEEGEPVTLQDNLTNDPGELSIQYSGGYFRSPLVGAKEVLQQGGTLKLGLFKDVQVSLNSDYATGRGGDRNIGDVLGDVLWHINDQTRLFPALGFDLFYSTPFGAGHKSAGYVFRAIASHSLGDGDAAPRLHLNLTDFHLTQPEEEGRKDQLQIAFGGSFLPAPEGAVVADVVYGASDERHRTETYLEIGYTRELPHSWTLELGVGKQVAGAANAVRVFFSVETEVHVF